MDNYADSVTIENTTPLPLTIDIGSGEVIPGITRRNLRLGAIRQLPWHFATNSRPIDANYNLNVIFNDPWAGEEDLYPTPFIAQWFSVDNTTIGQQIHMWTDAFGVTQYPMFTLGVGVLFAFQNLANPGGLLFRQFLSLAGESAPYTNLPTFTRLPTGSGFLFVPCQGIVGLWCDTTNQPSNYRVDVTGWFGGR
jgi:hypothetical protein